MLDDRKAAILSAVVTEYIETAQPVGSSTVSAVPGVDVSSATVRNEMGALEDEGFLYQPHTSAGRVPTEKGYRQFVDGLAEPTALARRDSQQVNNFFAQTHDHLEGLLAQTSSLLSSLTDCAAVVVGPEIDDEKVLSTQIVRLASTTALVVVVLSGGAIDKRSVEIPEMVTDAEIAEASAVLDRATRGRVRTDLHTVSAPETGLSVGVISTVSACVGVLAEVGDDGASVFVEGASRVATAFDAVATVSEVLVILEKQLVVVTLLRDLLDRGLNVAIGSETGVEPLAECSLVVAPYGPDGSSIGTIGVLGPTRMNYPHALAAVALVSNTLGHTLAEAGDPAAN
jgi:heat-inducible transcriptional repressor